MNPWRYKGRYHIHKTRLGCYNYEHSENMKKAPRNEKYDDKKKKINRWKVSAEAF